MTGTAAKRSDNVSVIVKPVLNIHERVIGSIVEEQGPTVPHGFIGVAYGRRSGYLRTEEEARAWVLHMLDVR